MSLLLSISTAKTEQNGAEEKKKLTPKMMKNLTGENSKKKDATSVVVAPPRTETPTSSKACFVRSIRPIARLLLNALARCAYCVTHFPTVNPVRTELFQKE